MMNHSVLDQTNLLRQQLKEDRILLEQTFQKTGEAQPLLYAHSQLIDRYLTQIWQQLTVLENHCLVAVGGYGRAELYPRSDIDILILLNKAPDSEQEQCLQKLISLLWDIGLEVGHSIRTLDECQSESCDITVLTNLLESRFITGNHTLFEQLQQRIYATLDIKQFFIAKRDEQQQRHTRYADIDFNLEPNLKESPGGLRDLQNIIWISRAAGLGTRWNELAKAGLITPTEARQLIRHETLLHTLRIRLHYLAKRREDRMLFEFQPLLANEMGVEAFTQRRASERLMKRYYRTKMAVLQFNRILLQNLRDQILGAPTVSNGINEYFRVKDHILEVRDLTLFASRPETIFELFLVLARYPDLTEIESQTLRALWHARKLIDSEFRLNPVVRSQFIDILRQPRGVVHNLRRMNQLGILGRYIPAFGRIVGQMQYDLFHVYTVDEHTLMVVRNLRRFSLPDYAHEAPLCSQLMKEFARPEVLYLAGLFHDIAKGRGGDHSILGKKDAKIFATEHGLSTDDCDLAAWLVEQHLSLSSTAQKQDLSDPDVIVQFAQKIKNDRYLVALFLLSVADVRGTSPKVWNGWKAKLFETLFYATRRYLRDGQTSNQLDEIKQDSIALLNLYAISPESYRLLWAQLEDSYFIDHVAHEIAWHTRLLARQVNSERAVVKARLSRIGEGIQVLVYCKDQPNLFARMCVFFARINYTIMEAKIHTSHHGYVVNSFQVLAVKQLDMDYRDVLALIEFELAQQIEQSAPVKLSSSGRIGRQLRHFPIPTKVEISTNGQHATLFLSAGDRPGLLARFALILDNHEISVHQSKINTLGGRVEDMFWVSGSLFEHEQRVIALKQELEKEL